MLNLLPPWPALSLFLLAALGLALTPGPGVLYIITRSLTQGRRVGLLSVVGIALGNLVNMVLAAVGLAALLATSATLFTLLQSAGALYLIYLGLERWWQRPPAAPGAVPPQAGRRAVVDGLWVALLNPKTTLFFAAFLPQFLRPGPSPMAQAVALGGLFVAIAALTDGLYALTAGGLAPRLFGNPRRLRWGRYGGGALLIALGLLAAYATTRPRA